MGTSTDAGGGQAVDSGGSADPPAMNRMIGIYFMGFYFAAGICLLGVVHAILIDEFTNAMQARPTRAGGALACIHNQIHIARFRWPIHEVYSSGYGSKSVPIDTHSLCAQARTCRTRARAFR